MPNRLDQIFDRGIAEALGRRLGLGDTGLTLMPELAATLQLESMPEMDFHLGWRKYMVSTQIAAGGAATFATVQIRMPRTVTLIARIEGIMFGPTATEVRVQGFFGTGELATALNGTVRDTLQQISGTVRGTCPVSVQALADIGNAGGGMLDNRGTINPPIFPLVLRSATEGVAGVTHLDGYQFQCNTANTAFDICIVWRERIVNDQENAP